MSLAETGTLQTIGDYDVLERIAEGGMGTVYKARSRADGQTVAIKVLPAHLAKNPILFKRFEKEYNATRALDHPNIVRALDFGYHGECPYLVMEYVDGETLGDRLEREHRIPEAEAIRIIAQVAQGLHKAHKQGLVHRDVKPDNVLITKDGAAKLADLGLVKELETDLNLTRTGRGLGTPHFMAPEQFRNAKNADVRCDIYSLGATLYMMVTGELPFKSLGPLEAWMKKVENKLTPPRDLVPELSERIDWAIRRAMYADPQQRPASCREFVEDLTGHSTRRLPTLPGSASDTTWHLRYKDEEGVVHVLSASLASIRKSLKEGYLGDASNIRAAREQNGTYEPIKNFPEFRDLVMAAVIDMPPAAPAQTPPPRQNAPPASLAGRQSMQALSGINARPPAKRETAAPKPQPASPQIPLSAGGDGGEVGRFMLFLLLAAGTTVAGYVLFSLFLH